jgi:hypothetical protein
MSEIIVLLADGLPPLVILLPTLPLMILLHSLWFYITNISPVIAILVVVMVVVEEFRILTQQQLLCSSTGGSAINTIASIMIDTTPYISLFILLLL